MKKIIDRIKNASYISIGLIGMFFIAMLFIMTIYISAELILFPVFTAIATIFDNLIATWYLWLSLIAIWYLVNKYILN